MKILVCDDNEFTLRQITGYVRQYTPKGTKMTLTSLSATEDILEHVKNNTYDIAFLDIQLENLNGVKLATVIRKKNIYAIIIFISFYSGYVSEAFTIRAYQYMYKPIEPEAFKKQYHRALRSYARITATCTFDTLDGQKILPPSNIMYVETYYHRIKIVTTQEVYLASIKQKRQIKETLKRYNFIQIHQSYFVNLTHVQVCHQSYLTLINRQQLPISYRHREEVKNKFFEYIISQSLDCFEKEGDDIYDF